MINFDEWEGRDPLDFKNRPQKSNKKNTFHKKPFHKTPAGIACGCVVLILLIAIIWNSMSNFESQPTASQVGNGSSTPLINYRTITPEEQKLIGQQARKIWDLHEQYIYLTHNPEFIKERVYSQQYHTWQDHVKQGCDKLNELFPQCNLKEYYDLHNAYTALLTVSCHFAMRKQNYDKQEKESFEIIQQNCKPYLEW